MKRNMAPLPPPNPPLDEAWRNATLREYNLKVRLMTPADEAQWDAFVYSCAEATFFHRAGWQKVIQGAFGHRTYFLLAEVEGEIQGVLPLAEINSRLFGHSLSALPFCVYGGIAASSESARLALDSAAQALAESLRVDFLEYRNQAAFHQDWPHKFLYYTFRKAISADPAANLHALPNRRRAMIRKGINSGLSSEIDSGIERFYTLFAANAHRHGTPVLPRIYFQLLQEVFGSDCEILSVLKQGNALSSVLSFYFRDEVLPYHAGDAIAARDCAANDFKYWELMRRAGERGIRIFDFGRSKQGSGAFAFKKNWGFAAQPLHYEYRLYRVDEVPNINPMNNKFKLFISLWKSMPLAMANRLGPHIIKYLG